MKLEKEGSEENPAPHAPQLSIAAFQSAWVPRTLMERQDAAAPPPREGDSNVATLDDALRVYGFFDGIVK